MDWLSSVSVTSPGLRVQPVVMPFGDPQSWTLVDQDAAVVEPVEAFLSHLHAIERSPNTVKAYAHDLRDWFEFLDRGGLVWSRVRLEEVGRFVAWLRLPAAGRVGNVSALPTAESMCSEATVNRKLSAISAFYEFHQRHGVDLGDLLTTWQRRKGQGGSWRPLLAHLWIRLGAHEADPVTGRAVHSGHAGHEAGRRDRGGLCSAAGSVPVFPAGYIRAAGW